MSTGLKLIKNLQLNITSKVLLIFSCVLFVVIALTTVTNDNNYKKSNLPQKTVATSSLPKKQTIKPKESSVATSSTPTIHTYQSEEELVIAAVKKVNPSVVSIIISKDIPKLQYINPFEGLPNNNLFEDDFFRQFNIRLPQQIPQNTQQPNETQKQKIGGGTGFIISSDGLIITNKHVVTDENAEYTVMTNDEKSYTAKILARDTLNDFAFLKIEASKLPTVEMGDSGSLQLGQTVIAIGNTLGEFRNTVSKGVISGLSRAIVARGGFGLSEQLKNVIQTDAAINEGNSGGPLIDLKGRVVGINTAIALGAQSVGFAIPINEAKQIIDNVRKNGKIVRPFLGVRYILINKELAQKNNLQFEYGALVTKGRQPEDLAVIPGSPADKAGITENTIILEINNQIINEKNTLAEIIAKSQVNKDIDLKVLQQGNIKNIKVKLIEQ